jgi:RNA 2',3'-cyclic 3'-phosphodiesterase
MSLFTAVWPSDKALRHLASVVDGLRAEPERLAAASAGLHRFRFLPEQNWHVTLCFHGRRPDDTEQDRLGARLDRRVARVSGMPRLRLAGCGLFRGVLWVGVEPDSDADAGMLRELVRAAGADPGGFHGHLTVARWASGRPDRAALRSLFSGYAGPWWTVPSIALVRGDQEAGARVYRTVHRVELPRPDAG